MKDKTSIIDAMFRKQMDAAFNFARLMHTGRGNGCDKTGCDRDGL